MEWELVMAFPTMGIALLAALSSACSYDPRFEDCAVRCDGKSCPSGLACDEEGFCRLDDAMTTCELPTDGSGGMISHAGGRTIHTFSVGATTFVPPTDVTAVELLVVGGGGGGGSSRGGGGGGAGGLVHEEMHSISETSINVLVGAGGPSAMPGSNSSFDDVTAIGGGAGRPSASASGGCGGGAGHDTNDGSGGLGTNGQGQAGGGTGYNSGSEVFAGAGGGGSVGRGADGYATGEGNGGAGTTLTISGTSRRYAGGGGGGAQDLGSHGLVRGLGDSLSGGDGGLNAMGVPGIDGTGGGGGGGGGFMMGAHGGDGVVIASYPTVRP